MHHLLSRPFPALRSLPNTSMAASEAQTLEGHAQLPISQMTSWRPRDSPNVT